MFIGSYYHTLETNGRVSLPTTFRNQAKSWVATRGLDGGLFLFPANQFAKRLTGLNEAASFTKKAQRDFARLMANEAQNVPVDKSGRVHLPNYLIAFAGLKKSLVVVGSLEYIEIWERSKYHKYVDTLEKNAASIAEKVI
jgi:MraZ protein